MTPSTTLETKGLHLSKNENLRCPALPLLFDGSKRGIQLYMNDKSRIYYECAIKKDKVTKKYNNLINAIEATQTEKK